MRILMILYLKQIKHIPPLYEMLYFYEFMRNEDS